MQYRAIIAVLLALATIASPLSAPSVRADPPVPSGARPASTVALAGALWRLPQISAEAAIVVDDATGEVIYGKNDHKRQAPASLTKIVTAIVALERGSLQASVPIDVHWSELKDSTRMGLIPGERLTLENLLYGLLLLSGNDAAVAIARYIGGSEEAFAELMNEKAAELGLTDSHFVNPHGLDADGHYTSVYDITQFGRYAMRNPEFARIVGTSEITVRGAAQTYEMPSYIRRWLNGYAGADGVKTGLTDNAGLAFVASATRNGRRAFASVIRSNAHLADAGILLDYFFNGRSWLDLEEAAGLSHSYLARHLGEAPSPSPTLPLARLPDRWESAVYGSPRRGPGSPPPPGQYEARRYALAGN